MHFINKHDNLIIIDFCHSTPHLLLKLKSMHNVFSLLRKHIMHAFQLQQ
ncbi:hypothetical protein [Candidatus Tisiphia endosymbiont of Nemotelus uliginosus]